MTIPKIIHHIAPKNKSRWHPIWDRCYPSWREHFTDFKHILWEDQDEINKFVHDYYPQYYKMFMEFPAHIMRIDFIRFCLLHHYGGIYSDMDMFCYKNFYNELTHTLHIIEAPYGDEFLESSLMMSVPGHEFWLDCMELSKEVFYTKVQKYGITIPFNNNRADQYLLQSACGPNLICRVWRKWVRTRPSELQTLPGILYNNHGLSYHPEYRTKHMMTGMWGKEAMDCLHYQKDIPLRKILDKSYIASKKYYADITKVNSVIDFDFYHDYTNGGMKTYFNPDFESNDIDSKKELNYE
jgi:mannosyltransferase OCH1-like enzyme